MSLVDAPVHENRILLQTDWEGYEKILDAIGDGHVRVTYDEGQLELMAPSSRHEVVKKVLAALLECLMEECEIEFRGGGSTTFKRKRREKGLEPDECYWMSNIFEVRDGPYDLSVSPPPDLAIEVEVTHSAIDRLGIYRALGVPEVWRCSPIGAVRVLCLSADGEYQEYDVSPTFPEVPLDVIQAHVRIGLDKGQMSALRAFRKWVRENVQRA